MASASFNLILVSGASPVDFVSGAARYALVESTSTSTRHAESSCSPNGFPVCVGGHTGVSASAGEVGLTLGGHMVQRSCFGRCC